jgi:hypothetical protein
MTDRTLSPLDTYTFNKSNTYSLRDSDLARNAQGLSYVTGERALVQENTTLSQALTLLKGDQLHVEVDKFDLNSDDYKKVCHFESKEAEYKRASTINKEIMDALDSAKKTLGKSDDEITAYDYKNMQKDLGMHNFAKIANIVDTTNTTRNANITENIDNLSKAELDAKKADLQNILEIKRKAYKEAEKTYMEGLDDTNTKLIHMKNKESEVQSRKTAIDSRESTFRQERDILTGIDLQNRYEKLTAEACALLEDVRTREAEAREEKDKKDADLEKARRAVDGEGWFSRNTNAKANLASAQEEADKAAEKAERAEKEKTTLEKIIDASAEATNAIKEKSIDLLETAIHKLSALSYSTTLAMDEVLYDKSLIDSYVAAETQLPDEQNQLNALEAEAKKAKEEYEISKTHCQSLKDDKESKASEIEKAQERLEDLKLGGISQDIKTISIGEQNSFFNKGLAKKINDLFETRYGAEIANKAVDHNTINWDEIDNIFADKSKNEEYHIATKQGIKKACIKQLQEFEGQVKSSNELIQIRVEALKSKKSALLQIAKSDIRERIKENKATLVYLDKMRTNDLFERDQKLSHFLTDLDRLQQLWASVYR